MSLHLLPLFLSLFLSFFFFMSSYAFCVILHPYLIFFLLIFLLLLLYLVCTQQCRREDRGDTCDAWKRNKRTPKNSKVRSHHSLLFLSLTWCVCVYMCVCAWCLSVIMSVLFKQLRYYIWSALYVTFLFAFWHHISFYFVFHLITSSA